MVLQLSLQTLQNLCSIRVAYLMWSRYDLSEWQKEDIFENYVDIVLADVQNLPVPETMKPSILKQVKPAGKHLILFLNLWFSKMYSPNSQKWLTAEMLIECLVLNADGLINQRKTAEKLLRNSLLDSISAFRFACVNFLEKEVLLLWPSVKQYYLNKIILASEQFQSSLDAFFNLNSFASNWKVKALYGVRNKLPDSETFQSTTEPDEVLFWTGYCLSKENAINMKELPHFRGKCVDWHKYSLESAASSGNVACFDYFYNFCNAKVECNYVAFFEEFFTSLEDDRLQPCFVFHFMLLNYEEKLELFRKFPKEVASHFLQWPLSLTFVENIEELWNLIPDGHKGWVFEKIFVVLFHKNPEMHTFQDIFHQYRVFGKVPSNSICGIYSVDHLENIWVSLWNISSDTDKSPVFDYLIFPSIVKGGRNLEFIRNFFTLGLKEKLVHLFLTNGEAILELYRGTNLEESLKNLIANHIPEGFEEGEQRYIPVRLRFQGINPFFFPHIPGNILEGIPSQVEGKFLNYIKNFLFSSGGIVKSFFYE